MDREELARRIEFLMGDTKINDEVAMAELVKVLQ